MRYMVLHLPGHLACTSPGLPAPQPSASIADAAAFAASSPISTSLFVPAEQADLERTRFRGLRALRVIQDGLSPRRMQRVLREVDDCREEDMENLREWLFRFHAQR